MGPNVSGPYRLLAADSAGAVYDFDVQHAVSQYEAVSDIATPPRKNYDGRAELSGKDRRHYLRLPAVDPRVRASPRRWLAQPATISTAPRPSKTISAPITATH